MTTKAALIDWTIKEEGAHGKLLALFGEHRGQIDVMYEGENFAAFTYKDNALDVLKTESYGRSSADIGSLLRILPTFIENDYGSTCNLAESTSVPV